MFLDWLKQPIECGSILIVKPFFDRSVKTLYCVIERRGDGHVKVKEFPVDLFRQELTDNPPSRPAKWISTEKVLNITESLKQSQNEVYLRIMDWFEPDLKQQISSKTITKIIVFKKDDVQYAVYAKGYSASDIRTKLQLAITEAMADNMQPNYSVYLTVQHAVDVRDKTGRWESGVRYIPRIIRSDNELTAKQFENDFEFPLTTDSDSGIVLIRN